MTSSFKMKVIRSKSKPKFQSKFPPSSMEKFNFVVRARHIKSYFTRASSHFAVQGGPYLVGN